jgi:hypothetical protein
MSGSYHPLEVGGGGVSTGEEGKKQKTQLVDHESANIDELALELTLLYEGILLIKERDEGWAVVSTVTFRCKGKPPGKKKTCKLGRQMIQMIAKTYSRVLYLLNA